MWLLYVFRNPRAASPALEAGAVFSGRAVYANLCITADVSSWSAVTLMIVRNSTSSLDSTVMHYCRKLPTQFLSQLIILIRLSLTGPHAFEPKKIYFVPKVLMKQPHYCSY